MCTLLRFGPKHQQRVTVQQMPFTSKQAGHVCKYVPDTLCSHATDFDDVRQMPRLTLLLILARQLRILAFC